MDDIREWISDNLRYILLVLALILVLAVAVLGIRAISNIASGGSVTKKETEKQTETDKTQDVIVETDSQNTAGSGALTENDAKVLTTMTSYYSARTNNDTATLKKLDPSYDEQAASATNYVESYNNVKTYSQAGPAEGSYLAYVCYEGKVKDIDTLVPSLTQFYLETNADGSLYIADITGNTQAEQFVEESRKSSEVQALIEEVNQRCEDAKASDPALKEFMDQYGNTQGGGTDDSQSEDGTVLVANDICNIRAEANTDSEVYATLYVGESVTKTGETDDGWTQIDYNGQTAYVKSEFLSTQEQADSEAAASDFAPAAAQ